MQGAGNSSYVSQKLGGASPWLGSSKSTQLVHEPRSVLGEAVGYSSCQAAVMVSGLWGIFYFGEAPRGSIYFGLGALICTSGIVLLSLL